MTENLAGAYFTNANGENLGTCQKLGNILDTGNSVTQTYYVGYKITQDDLTYSKVAVGLRSLNGGTVDYSVNESSASVSSTVDMYYQVTPNNGAIVITNNSDNVLALTKIKVTGMTSDISLASAFSMDADTMAYALRCIAGETEETQPAEAALTIQVANPDGNLLAETVLNVSGIVGESYTFTASLKGWEML